MARAETEITAELIRGLLRDQHPDLADRPIAFGARGWDNQLWRLGDDLAVRLPWATRHAGALRALDCILIADAGVRGRPGGKPTWGPPARDALRRLTASDGRR